jgi:two-component system KDP operon response regulator KdpE
MAKILIIEDDRSIQNFIRVLLGAQGYEVLEARDAKSGITLALSYDPDVILLDLGLPDLDGIEVIRQIRPLIGGSIVVVSAREQERDKIDALDLGADDYLTKPFNAQELLARIRVALRHRSTKDVIIAEEALSVRDLTLDLGLHRLLKGTQEIHLTPIEFDVMTLLMRYRGKVLTHRALVKHVWGEGSLESDLQTLRVTMANLRRKIEDDPARPDYIITEIGTGYRLKDE